MAKYCAKCGAPMEDSARFCPKCGYAPQPRQWSGGSQPFQNGGFVPQQQSYQPPFQQPSMKWFKFVIWVQLFLAALTNLGTAIGLLTGSIYGDYAGLVYAFYGGLRALDIIIALLCLALAGAAIYVRFQLSGFKRMGPTLYLYFLLANVVVSLFYVLVASLILGGFAGDASTIASLVTSAVLLVLSRTYFEKRRFLFVR